MMFGKFTQLDRAACAVMAAVIVLVAMVCAGEAVHTGFGVVSTAAATVAPMQPASVNECRVVEVNDGETVTVELNRKLRVRLFDESALNADQHAALKTETARQHLRALAENCDAVLYIPEKREQTQPFFLPETVAGTVRLVNDRDTLAQHQVAVIPRCR